MDPRRPRHSVLSLFDPLAGSPHSSDDKENNVGESSFFYPPGFRNAAQPSSQPAFRRRLIDVGDITMDEPDMEELLAQEEELDLDIADDNDNDTLTFRDIALAATPKWSGRQFTKLTTPKSVMTPKSVQTPPRTPLADICFKDEVTPMARKKSRGRPVLQVTSSAAQMQTATSIPSTPPPISIPHKVISKHSETLPVLPPSPPRISVSLDDEPTERTPEEAPRDALGSSVCTLNLPAPTGALIADTSIPLSVSPSSPRSSFGSSLSPSDFQSRLRPNPPSQNDASRLSVDLQSSFQMHMSSSDTSFDLLNEKLSFFNIKDDADSFMNMAGIDNSFGDDDFAPAPPVPVLAKQAKGYKTPSPPPSVAKPSPGPSDTGHSRRSPPASVSHFPTTSRQLKEKSNRPGRHIHSRTSSSTSVFSSTTEIPDSVESIASFSPPKDTVPPEVTTSTASQCAVPVPALKIVKRSRVLTRPPSVVTASSSRRLSSMSSTHSAVSRLVTPSSPMEPSFMRSRQPDDFHSMRGAKRPVPAQAQPSAPVLGGGPQRVLISEGPKLAPNPGLRTAAHLERTKPYSSSTGPQRSVDASSSEKPPILVARPTPKTNSGLKQPTKYATIGPTSAIPKPTARVAGSKLPAPASSTVNPLRIGVPGANKGLPARRLA
ncbi:hypothetical protein D9613_002154 [Agrocybe pediades]|uniref:Uncharacterized protein n=1 Tax=Agrocybe pediades TaxID=84607 RepID=A0A8H4R4K0_9AGAR|nr:hypothetical protein D9613_002154 [Agrocybe pediades]